MKGHRADRRKKLLVFFSRGGGGHIAAADAISGYFNGCHAIIPVNIITDILASLDPIRRLSRGRFNGEDLYNWLQMRSLYGLLNLYSLKFGRSFIAGASQRIKQLMKAYLERERPDLVISVMPYFNAPIAAATGELGIPFLIVSVDLDSTTYIYGLEQEKRDHLFLCLPHDSPSIRATIAPAGLEIKQIRITGFPVRPSFIAPADPRRIKEAFALSNESPIVILLMGAAGADQTIRFAREMAKINQPIQLIIGTGRNRKLYEKVRSVPSPSHIKRHVLPFTPRIADLMGVADLIVTKSGPVTIFEAIHRELPMVIDATTRLIHWEKMNVAFIEEQGIGTVNREVRELPHIVSQHLFDGVYRTGIKHNIAAFEKKIFRDQFKMLISEIAS